MTESGPHAASSLPPQWEILRTPAADGVTNMAVDAALLDAVRTGVAVWRWYAWAAPTVSFGRPERVAGRFAPERLAAAGLAAVRRPTGGRALLHHQELTYSVTLPLASAQPWRPTYAAINRVLCDALRAIGVAAEIARGVGALRPDGPICFEAPAEGEIVVDGRKLVGSAIWRQGGGYLQHGSLLFADEQARLAETASVPLPAAPPAATLQSLLPGVPAEALAERVMRAVRDCLAAIGEVTVVTPAPSPPLSVASHIRQLADPRWIWRR
ncbi:MAG: biotin/lipoate A/B protein ligase family protein [Gemmatimonas sp.]|uniref:lipoate--protein ligase family protein n=1 Tax=Gemmatimonas sp. TaxID=1962908 RepID=UPI00391FA4D3